MSIINDIAQQTINYEVYVDGARYLGTATVDLPEVTYMTNEIAGAGIAGKVDMPTLSHIENMEITLHWRNFFERPTHLMNQNTFMLSLRGAMQRYDAALGIQNVYPIRIDVRCLSVTTTIGKFEPSEQTETESKFNIDYIKIMVGGAKVFEHDKFNYIHEVEGVDYLAPVRSALGL